MFLIRQSIPYFSKLYNINVAYIYFRWSGSWSNGQLVEGHFVPVPDGRLYNRMSNNPMYIRPSAPGEFRRLCTVHRLYIVESVSFPNLVSDLL